jgi:predicted RNA-binding Zn-ribbon protein involved in translation (DUF1610 family)
MPQVIMVTSRRHACPNCGHIYWTNTYTTLRLGSPFRKCEQCGQEFIDKDLYREWACMTRGQRRRYMHYRLNQGLEMMRISSYVLFPIGLYLTIIIGPLA